MSNDKNSDPNDPSLERRLPGWALLIVGALFSVGGPAYLLASEAGTLWFSSSPTVAEASAVSEDPAAPADAMKDDGGRRERFRAGGGGVAAGADAREDDLRLLRYHATCQARFGGRSVHVAAVSPPASANSLPVASRMDGSAVCRQHVGGGGRTNWTCLGVHLGDETSSKGWLGTDGRASWASCSRVFPEPDGHYSWFQPGGGGPTIACCGL